MVRKGEIARFEQFLLLLPCFQSRLLQIRQKTYILGKAVRDYGARLGSLSKQRKTLRQNIIRFYFCIMCG